MVMMAKKVNQNEEEIKLEWLYILHMHSDDDFVAKKSQNIHRSSLTIVKLPSTDPGENRMVLEMKEQDKIKHIQIFFQVHPLVSNFLVEARESISSITTGLVAAISVSSVTRGLTAAVSIASRAIAVATAQATKASVAIAQATEASVAIAQASIVTAVVAHGVKSELGLVL